MHALLAINWEPQLRGILIIIISVSVLCGSIYLILGTNLGARLGFLVTLSALAGWMMLMGLVWWAFGIGLKGEAPTWQPVAGETILQTPVAVKSAGILDSGATLPAEDAPYIEQAEAVDAALIEHGWERLGETDPSFGQSAASGGVVIEENGVLGAGEYKVVNVFDKGGERYPKIGESIDFLAFLHKPHWIVVEVAGLLPQRDEPGRAPAPAEVDETQPHRYVYMVRDLGHLRVPAAIIAFGSGLVFFATCYLLHTRDRRVTANRTGALAVPAKV
jgi:hypothetical protein